MSVPNANPALAGYAGGNAEPRPPSQQDVVTLLGPLLLKDGAMYKKKGRVFLKKATPGAVLKTCLDGQVETTNCAEDGDWLCRADTTQKERYFISDEKFGKLYEQTPVSFADHPDVIELHAEGFNAYIPRGRIVALPASKELLMQYFPAGKFMASWGESMVVEEGDYLAAPAPPDDSGLPNDVTEVYRIEADAFAQTYKREVLSTNYVFLVRHGESRWNEAQNACNVCGMLSECDHGLSDEGREQARGLRKQTMSMKVDVEECIFKDSFKLPWVQRYLAPDLVITSPFTRAMQTAIIALEDITKKTGLLKVMWLPREVKTSTMSMDSTGSKRGEDLREHLRQSLDEFYQQSAWDDWLGPAMKRMDFENVQKDWWSEQPDTPEEVSERIDKLLENLVSGRKDSSTILVGHSNFYRALFRRSVTDSVQQDIADSIRTHMLPHCFPIGLKIEDDGLERRIVEVVPLLNEPKLAAASIPKNLFPVPGTRGCCGAEKQFQPDDKLGERPVQRRTCILNACNGARTVV